VKKNDYDGYLAADYEIAEREKEERPVLKTPFQPIDISKFFNCNIRDIHTQEYMSPRPQGYSIGVFPNGRYAWEWNHRGHNQLYVDDTALRNSGGLIRTQSGIPFITPTEKENVACASVWDNFPSELSIPLFDTGNELAILFISTTNSMQTGVENVRITVEYEDGETTEKSLVYPLNIDDWLVPALQKENEIYYFNDYNHATVQKITLNPNKKLACVKIQAIANEVIIGVLGVSISR
jgi:hypothetical protein